MKYIATTLHGIEGITEEETKGKKILPGRVSYEKAKKVLRSSLQSYELLKKVKFKDLDDLVSKAKKVKFGIKGSFKVECQRTGSHKFGSQDVQRDVGEYFFNKGNKVDLKKPKTVLFLDIIGDVCLIGENPIRYVKRDYKVRSGSRSINATISYALLKVANFKKNEILVDPFCEDGTILIEAGLLGGKELYGFVDDLKNARINMKVAGVKLNLSQHEIDWLDTLFKEKSVDVIITQPPFYSKRSDKAVVDSKLKELFHQANYILKDRGRMILLVPNVKTLEKYAVDFDFNDELKIRNGALLYHVISFIRK